MRRILKLVALATSLLSIVALGLAATFAASPAHAATGPGLDASNVTPEFVTGESASDFSADAITIPYWRSQFTDPTNGVTYPYTMVGNDPATNSSVTIPTVIVPLSFTFETSYDPSFHTLDSTPYIADTLASPVFDSSADIGAAASTTAGAPPFFAAGRVVHEPSDTTQLADAIVRAQWGKTGSGYHVLLGQPTILPTVSLDVPRNQGQILKSVNYGGHWGVVNNSWLNGQQGVPVPNLHLDPHALVIYLAHNILLYTGSDWTTTCCIYAYHGASLSLNGNGKQQVQTYIYAAYDDPLLLPNPGDTVTYVQDINPLSHELQEWMDNPFTSNAVTPWVPQDPLDTFFGACLNLLEVGDPVADYGFTVHLNGRDYHPQDEMHFSWFARQSPSVAESGYYSYLNNYPTPAQSC